MTTAGPQIPPPTPMTPPTDAGAIPPKPSSWPMVVGIIAIILGAGGILAYGCGGLIGNVGMVFVSNWMRSTGVVDPVQQAQMEVLRDYLAWNIVNSLFSTGLSILLLIAGIGLVRRRSSSMRVSIVWAILRMLWALPASVMGYAVAVAQFDAMERAAAESGDSLPAGIFGIMQAFGIVGVVLGLLWACAFPIFTLIWFSRRKIKAEIAQWGRPASALG